MGMLENPTPNTADDSAGTAPDSSEWDVSEDIAQLDSPSQSTPEAQDGSEAPAKPATAAPMQKRRRVTRACDECRRKKIKCDGKQPCTHCTVYSYECTYDQPSNRRRNAAPQYIEALEKRMKRMEAMLNIVLPGVDLEDPHLEAALQQNAWLYKNGMFSNGVGAGQLGQAANPHVEDSHLESMVKSTGQLDLDEEGYWDFHGHSSGLSFVRRMREQYPDMIGEPPQAPARSFAKSRPMSQVFESPKLESPGSAAESPVDGVSPYPTYDLPAREVAKELVENAINDAASLLRVVHEPTIWKHFDRIYDLQPENYTNEDNTFLPLLYSILALGSLFSQDAQALDAKGYETAIEQGFKYFRVARLLMDVADCRDLRSLQAMVFMILFLQSSAKLSTCYSYIGVALRSALRMGLHRNIPGTFSPIESETRKRVFWVIRKMDTYVGALLGLPHTLNDEDIDQVFPVEVSDAYITETEILPMPEGSISVMTASNAHTTLVAIIAKIVKYIYPLKGAGSGQQQSVQSYSVGYAKIREIELDLQVWMQKLPMGLKPGGDAPKIIIRVQQMLRMAYAHAQMMLYRPFLHYVSHTCKTKVVDKRSYACAAACVSVSRNIIHITSEMKKRGLLCGAYWFQMYTTFFAILSLVFFALENPDNQTSQDVLRDAKEGKDTLEQLAKRSMAADRCTHTLNALFEQLPERLRRGRQESISGRKRRQEASPHPLAHLSSSEDLTNTPIPTLSDAPRPRRASTYHYGATTADVKPLSQSVPLAQAQLGLDSNYTFPPTPTLMESTPCLTPSSASTSGISFMQGANGLNGLNGSFNGMPLSPTVVTNFNDANMPLPDLTSMMFPSADPFAYPNQSMTTSYADDFDSKDFGIFEPTGMDTDAPATNGDHQRLHTNGAGGSNGTNFVPSSTFLPRNTSASGEDVQLFGPLPMYQIQGGKPTPGTGGGGAPHFTDPFSGQQLDGSGGGAQQGLDGEQHAAVGHMADGGVAGMNLDDLFGGEEWAGLNMGGEVGGLGSAQAGLGALGAFRSFTPH